MEAKHKDENLNLTMHFAAGADILKNGEILIACNVNQLDIYNSISDYLHTMHISVVTQ